MRGQLGGAAVPAAETCRRRRRRVQAVPFSELMLECLERPELAAAENSLDYFLMANTGERLRCRGGAVGLA